MFIIGAHFTNLIIISLLFLRKALKVLAIASKMNSKDQTKRIVIANSYLTMEIKNIQSQKEFQSKQVEINEIDGASW